MPPTPRALAPDPHPDLRPSRPGTYLWAGGAVAATVLLLGVPDVGEPLTGLSD